MSIQVPPERRASRLGCGGCGGQLSSPGFSLFPEPLAPMGAELVITGEARPALPPGTQIESRFSSEGGCGRDPATSVHVTDTQHSGGLIATSRGILGQREEALHGGCWRSLQTEAGPTHLVSTGVGPRVTPRQAVHVGISAAGHTGAVV